MSSHYKGDGQQYQGQGGGANCPEKNGRFPVASQCDAYIECVDGVGEQKLCPDGLLFNAKAPFTSYPCQYPPEVDCEGRSGLRKSTCLLLYSYSSDSYYICLVQDKIYFGQSKLYHILLSKKYEKYIHLVLKRFVTITVYTHTSV